MDASTNMSGMSMSMDTTSAASPSASAASLSLADQSSSLFSPQPPHSSSNSFALSAAETAASAAIRGSKNIDFRSTSSSNDDNNTNTNTTTSRNKNNDNGVDPNEEQNHDNNNGNHHSWNVEDARMNLRKAIQILDQRGLKLASKWAAEQLIGLVPPPPLSSSRKFNFHEDHHHHHHHHRDSKDNYDEYYYDNASDIELYAKSVLDLGEYHRAAAILSINPITQRNQQQKNNRNGITKGNTGGDLTIQPPMTNLSSYGIYLRAYALYMAGERRKEEEVLELRDPLERTTVSNTYLPQLALELHDYFVKNKLDAFGLYIYGIVLKEIQKSPSSTSTKHQGRKSPKSTILLHQQQKYRDCDIMDSSSTPSAHTIFIQSLIKYPYNWSAWMDLAEICISDPSILPEADVLLKPISTHWMYFFFSVHLYLENQANDNAIILMERLIQGSAGGGGGGGGANTDGGLDEEAEDRNDQGFFVSSPYLQSQLAVAHNNMRDYETALAYFDICSDRDPYRLDQMDVYSNILYVKENKVALSTLAHRAVKLDKYRPETCCIVGNYYSLKAQHEKAVQYFQRALKLDRTYLSAWTLMGHEYIEMKNTEAAIESYRRAVDVNATDYRAWYGLGQAYEILNMYLYALFYFQKAVELRPYDPRMWCAMGTCYMGLDRKNDAKRSYERAVANHDTEGIATKQLASLYREDGDAERAARCFLKHLELRYQSQLSQASMSAEGASVQTIISSINVDEAEAEAMLNLAIYHRDNGEFSIASLCCTRLLDYPGPEKEEAREMLLEMRSVIDRNQEL